MHEYDVINQSIRKGEVWKHNLDEPENEIKGWHQLEDGLVTDKYHSVVINTVRDLEVAQHFSLVWQSLRHIWLKERIFTSICEKGSFYFR